MRIERSFSLIMSFKLPRTNRKGHQSAYENFQTKNFQTKLITEYQIVSTSIFPFSLTVDRSAMITMCIGGLMVNSLFDSGSSVSLVTTSIVQQSGYPICEGFHKKLVSASGNQLEIMGRICLPIIVGDIKIDQMFVVIPN